MNARMKPIGSHTPGPWKLVQASAYGHWMVKAVHASYVIAECGVVGGQTGEANARLLAAAPDLLALAHYMVALENGTAAASPPADWLSMARAAIAKAEGTT